MAQRTAIARAAATVIAVVIAAAMQPLAASSAVAQSGADPSSLANARWIGFTPTLVIGDGAEADAGGAWIAGPFVATGATGWVTDTVSGLTAEVRLVSGARPPRVSWPSSPQPPAGRSAWRRARLLMWRSMSHDDPSMRGSSAASRQHPCHRPGPPL